MNLLKIFTSGNKKEIGWTTLKSAFSTGLKKSSIIELYTGVIFSCTDAIASHVSQTEWDLYDKRTDKVVDIHLAKELLLKPNNLTDTTLMYQLSTNIDIYGQAFLYPNMGIAKKQFLSLELLYTDGITPVISNSMFNDVDKYIYTHNGQVENFEKSQLVNIIRSNPFDRKCGLSTIEMARQEGQNDLNALDLDSAFSQNGATPSGTIETDKSLGFKEAKRLETHMKNAYQGKKNAFKLMFLTHGLKFTPISVSARDMEFVAKRRLNRDQILTIFKVPKSVVAVSDGVNKATAFAELKAFKETVVKPRLDLIFDALNYDYLPKFKDIDSNVSNLEFRYKNPIPTDIEEKAKIVTLGGTFGFLKINEARQMFDLDSIKGGDVLFTSTNQPIEPEKPKDDAKSLKKKL